MHFTKQLRIEITLFRATIPNLTFCKPLRTVSLCSLICTAKLLAMIGRQFMVVFVEVSAVYIWGVNDTEGVRILPVPDQRHADTFIYL